MTHDHATTTLCILVDALRHDYVDAVHTPFLHELASRHYSAPVCEPFAFQLRPAFFAGLWPEESGVAHLYMHDPEHSPYRFLKDIDLPTDLEGEREEKVRGWIRQEARRAEVCAGHFASGYYAHPDRIPLSLLPSFSYSEQYLTWMPNALPAPTIFDLMRAAGQRWLWIAYPEDDLRTAPMLDAFRERFRPHHRLVYLHFSELDWVGHAEGPHAPALRARLREIDAALREVVDHLEAAGKAWNAMIFGDHGMVPVGRTVDARAALEDTGLRAPEDYVYFLDSTQARCWFRTENARTRVEQALSHLSGGRILTDEDLARLRFRFADHRFGELIWMADEGVVLSPNFFQGYDPVLGMHGYLPEAEANWGKLIAVGSDRAGAATAPVDMVELFPLLRQLLNLESERI